MNSEELRALVGGLKEQILRIASTEELLEELRRRSSRILEEVSLRDITWELARRESLKADFVVYPGETCEIRFVATDSSEDCDPWYVEGPCRILIYDDEG